MASETPTPSEWAVERMAPLRRFIDKKHTHRFVLALEAAHVLGVAEERARCVAYLRRPCKDPAHHPAWCQSCELRGDDADAIECGAHVTTEDPR